MSTLSPREEKIIRLRFGFGMDREHTLEEVGSQFDVTRERIRQVEAKALRKLRNRSRWNDLIDWTDLKPGTAPPKPVNAKTDEDKAELEIESAESSLNDDDVENKEGKSRP